MNQTIFKIPNDLNPKIKPNYSKPIEIQSFSYDSNRNFHPNRSELVSLSHVSYVLNIL